MLLLVPAIIGSIGVAIMQYLNFWDMLKINESESWNRVLKIAIWVIISFLIYLAMTFLTILLLHYIIPPETDQ